jgi:hypothetical protein
MKAVSRNVHEDPPCAKTTDESESASGPIQVASQDISTDPTVLFAKKDLPLT